MKLILSLLVVIVFSFPCFAIDMGKLDTVAGKLSGETITKITVMGKNGKLVTKTEKTPISLRYAKPVKKSDKKIEVSTKPSDINSMNIIFVEGESVCSSISVYYIISPKTLGQKIFKTVKKDTVLKVNNVEFYKKGKK